MKKSAERSPRLLYLLPRYDSNSPEHIYHLYGFLGKLQDRIPLEVIVERAAGALPPDVPMRPLWIRVPALRLAEECIRFFLARLRGIKTFYVHYSYTGAIAASIVARLLGGRVFYWSCSLYKELRLGDDAPLGKRIRQRIDEGLLELSVRACTHLVTGTPRVADYYVRQAGIPAEKIRLLPNFADVERFRNGSRAEARKKLKSARRAQDRPLSAPGRSAQRGALPAGDRAPDCEGSRPDDIPGRRGRAVPGGTAPARRRGKPRRIFRFPRMGAEQGCPGLLPRRGPLPDAVGRGRVPARACSRRWRRAARSSRSMSAAFATSSRKAWPAALWSGATSAPSPGRAFKLCRIPICAERGAGRAGNKRFYFPKSACWKPSCG